MKVKSQYGWMLVLGCWLAFGLQGRSQTIFEEDFEGHSAGSWITSANDWRGVLNSGNIRITSGGGVLDSRVANGFEAVGGLEQAVIREVDLSEPGRYELTFDAYANLDSRSHEETHNVLMSFGRNTDQSAIRWGAEFTDEGGSLWKFGVHGHPNEIHPEIPFDQKIAFTIVMDTLRLETFGLARFTDATGDEKQVRTLTYGISRDLVEAIDRLYIYQDFRRPDTYVGVQLDNIALDRVSNLPASDDYVLLDEFVASSAVQGSKSQVVLSNGQEYVVELAGTYSVWDASDWAEGDCLGESEPAPMFGGAVGRVGHDPGYFFAGVFGSNSCREDRATPLASPWRQRVANEWLPLQPIPAEFSADHIYRFRVTGRGDALILSPSDDQPGNNYGDVRVRIFGPDTNFPGESSEVLFAESFESHSEGSWITSANDWRGVLNSGNIRISSGQGALDTRVANGFEAIGGSEQAVVREVDLSEPGRYELTFDAYANLDSRSHEETHNVLMSFGRNTDQSAIRWGAEFTDEGGSLWKFGVHGHPNEIHPEIPFDQKIAFTVVMDTESLEASGLARFEGPGGAEQIIQTESYSLTPQLVAEIDRLFMYQDFRRPGTYVGVQIDNLVLTRVTKDDSPAEGGTGGEPVNPGEVASRELDRETAMVGESVAITLRVNPTPDTLVYAVEEIVPEGLEVSGISDEGAFDVGAGSVKWGPFFDGSPRELSYSVQLDDLEPGELRFDGTVSIGGTSFEVGGGQVLSVEGVPLVEPPNIAGLIMLDELIAPSTRQRNLSNLVLEEGKAYVVELQGTYSVWSASTWNSGDCKGVSEERPMFGPAGGRVGFDPAYTFAIPRSASSCRDDLQLPQVRVWKYETREGTESFEPMPQPYSPEHRYRFSVIGEGAQLSFGTVDTVVWDNYGDIRVRIFGAGPTEPDPDPDPEPLPPESAIVGIRSLPETYLIGEPFEVVIETIPPSGTTEYSVREQIAERLNVVSVGAGAVFDENSRELRWGPFPDSEPRMLSYHLVATDGALDTLGFSGFIDLEGAEYETQGRQTMQRGLVLSAQPPPGFGCTEDGGLLTFLNSQGAVLDMDGNPAGADVWGQLYVGLSEDRLEPICEPRPVLALGVFSGGEQTVPGTSGGETVWVQLRAWRGAERFESAEIRGVSDLQQVDLKSPGALVPAPVPATSGFQLEEVPLTAEFAPLVRVGGTFILRWSGPGRLQEASSLGGPFGDSASQANPQEITIDPGVSRFFRIVRDSR